MRNQKETNFISAVVYVHNHGSALDSFSRELATVLSSHFEHFEIVYVNDISTDNSRQRIREAAAADGVSVSLIDLGFFHGLEAAMLAGVDAAIGDFIFEFDSPVTDYDFQEVMNVYSKALDGNDIVSASPDRPQKLMSAMFYKLFERYSRNRVRLYSETFRILSRRAVNRINILNEMIPYRKAIYFNCGLSAVNHKYDPVLPLPGNDQNIRERLQLAVNALVIFTDLGTRAALAAAVTMLFFTISTGIYVLFTFLTYRNVVEGWTTTMLFLSFAFTGLFGLIALLIKYSSLLVDLRLKKQMYVIESVEKI